MSARSDAALRHWADAVSTSSAGFESRWTQLALRRVSPSVAKALHEQRGLFDQACITGTVDEIETHGAAMCRGLAVAVRTLEGASEPDDAYQLGSDPVTGMRVAIGGQKAARERVRELHGSQVIWITPDEVAVLMSSVESFKALSAIQQVFPGGCEVIRRYADAGS